MQALEAAEEEAWRLMAERVAAEVVLAILIDWLLKLASEEAAEQQVLPLLQSLE